MDGWFVVSCLASLVQLATTAADMLAKIKERRDTPAAKAFEATVRALEPEEPEIRQQLAAFLASNEVKRVLNESLIQDNPREWLVPELEDRSLYFGRISKETAHRILQCLMENLDRALLEGTPGLYYEDKKAKSRTDALHADIAGLGDRLGRIETLLNGHVPYTQQVSNEVGPSLEPQWKDRVQRFKTLTEQRGPKAAVVLWEDLLDEIEDSSICNEQVLFEVLTNLASCFWQQGDYQKARDIFVRAHTVLPNDSRARLNLALAHMIDDRPAAAHELVDGVLKEQPENGRALAAKANVLVSEQRFPDVVALFEPYWDQDDRKLLLENADCCRMLGLSLLDLDLHQDAISVFEQGLTLDPPDAGLRVLLATALFQKAGGVKPTIVITDGDHEDLLRADTLFSEAVAALERLGLHAGLGDAFCNRSAVRMKLARHEDAYDDAKRAYLDDEKDPARRKNYALCALALGRVSEAVTALEEWVNLDFDIEACALLFEVYSERPAPDRLSRAQAILQSNMPGKELSQFPTLLLRAYGDLLVSVGDLEEADEVASALDPGTVASQILRGEIEAKRGNSAASKSHLALAREIAVKANDKSSLAEIGFVYYGVGDWENAVVTFAQVGVTEWSPRSLVARYLASMYNCHSSRHEDAISSLSMKFRKARGLDPVISQGELRIFEARGDFESAISLLDDLIRAFPSEPEFRIDKVRCQFRMGDRVGARATLSLIGESKDLGEHQLMLLAHIHSMLDDDDTALELGYEAWRRGRSDQHINLGLISLFLGRSDRNSRQLTVDVVGEGVAVTAVFDDLAEQTWVITKPYQAALPEEIAVDSEPALRLSGHRKGDVVTWTTGPSSPRTCTVKDVRHRFVWAFQTALQVHPLRFPTDVCVNRKVAHRAH